MKLPTDRKRPAVKQTINRQGPQENITEQLLVGVRSSKDDAPRQRVLDDKGCGEGSNGKIINEEREGVRVNYNELEKRGSSKRSKSLLSKGCVRLQVLSLRRALARQDIGTAKDRWS